MRKESKFDFEVYCASADAACLEVDAGKMDPISDLSIYIFSRRPVIACIIHNLIFFANVLSFIPLLNPLQQKRNKKISP